MAHCVSNRLQNLHIGYTDEKLASFHACVESNSKSRGSGLPDLPNQPTSYSLFGKKAKVCGCMVANLATL